MHIHCYKLFHNRFISYFFHSKLLVLEMGSTPLHLALLPASPDTHLLSGCDDGLYIFDIQLSKNTQKRFDFNISSVCVWSDKRFLYCNLHVFFRNEEMEIVFPIYKKKDKKNTYRTIDGLSFLSDDIVGE